MTLFFVEVGTQVLAVVFLAVGSGLCWAVARERCPPRVMLAVGITLMLLALLMACTSREIGLLLDLSRTGGAPFRRLMLRHVPRKIEQLWSPR